MRIIRYFLTGIILISILGVSAFLIAREVFMYWGVSVVRGSVQEMAKAQHLGVYQTQCQQLGKAVGPNGVLFQLRFLSDTEYVLEALCNEASNQPISVGRDSLPPFVSKVKGTSGFITNGSPSGIQLATFWQLGQDLDAVLSGSEEYISKSKILQFEEGMVIESKDPTVLGNGPITTCNGYGYSCCTEESQKGIGDRITGLFDCEQSCYSQCVSRPLILSFTTNPFFDLATRSVEVTSGTTVEFMFVGDTGNSDSVSGYVDFGDGNSQPITEESGQASHSYSCSTASCSYDARVALTDKWGVESAEIPITKVRILVQGK